MKQSKVLIPTSRMPADASSSLAMCFDMPCAKLLVFAISACVYSYLPLANRRLKAKGIMPANSKLSKAGNACPALSAWDLWRESGRYGETTGEDLYKLKTVKVLTYLGPTHEETFTAIQRLSKIYKHHCTLNLYQIQPKIPRWNAHGVCLLRPWVHHEIFAYSFHANYDSLDVTYDEYKAVYERIFTRSGIDYKAIIGDGGAMGGKDSQEFMAVTSSHRLWSLFYQISGFLWWDPSRSPRRNQSRIVKWLRLKDTLFAQVNQPKLRTWKWLLNEIQAK